MRIIFLVAAYPLPIVFLSRLKRIAGLRCMKVLLGRKLGMSQVFSETGEVLPVTLIHAEPNTISLRRKADTDGYEAVQLALPKKAAKDGEKRTPRALQRMFHIRREFRAAVADDVVTLGVDQFVPGDVIEISGTTKGKGFQGVVKRHGFKGGPASHGHTDWERGQGSIGSRFPQHTRPGKRMAGRMGTARVTVKNLQVVSVDPEKNVLAVKGAVPGPRGSLVEIRSIEETHE